MSRYQRQICLSEVGDKGQLAISSARILVVGAGGLGCAVLPYLVSAGVGHISVVDGDLVSLSNLHRQVLYRESDIGSPKVDFIKQHLHAINSECNLITHFTSLSPSNVANLCDGVDIVLDCADNFATTYVLSDHCYKNSQPLVSASVLGFNGYIGGFCAGNPSLRAVFPELPQRAQNCSSAGVMGPVVGAVGCIQAQFALNVLLSLTPSPLGQLLSIDLRNLNQSTFRFDDAPEPPIEQQLGFIGSGDINQQDWLVDLRALNQARVEVEANTETQCTQSAPVQRFSLKDFQHNQPQPKTNQRAVIVCRTGLTAWQAARILQDYWQGDIRLIAMGDTPL